MTSLRLSAVRRLMQLVSDEVSAGVESPERVQVVSFDPGRELQHEAIYVVDVAGTPAPAGLAGGMDQPTADDFMVDVVCRATLPGATGAGQQDRADDLYQAVRRAVLDVSYGSDLDGLPNVASVELGTVDGPLVGPDDQGFVGFYKVQIRVITDEVSS